MNISTEFSNYAIFRALAARSWALEVLAPLRGTKSMMVTQHPPPGTIPQLKSKSWSILWSRVKQGSQQCNQGSSNYLSFLYKMNNFSVLNNWVTEKSYNVFIRFCTGLMTQALDMLQAPGSLCRVKKLMVVFGLWTSTQPYLLLLRSLELQLSALEHHNVNVISCLQFASASEMDGMRVFFVFGLGFFSPYSKQCLQENSDLQEKQPVFSLTHLGGGCWSSSGGRALWRHAHRVFRQCCSAW